MKRGISSHERPVIDGVHTLRQAGSATSGPVDPNDE
jgi:hypothetical protein